MSDNPDVSQAVVDTARRMYDIGLVVGTAGNVSGRRADGSIVMTPSSVPYADIAVDNLAVMDLDGATVSGSARPSTEKAMHLACYNAFSEVGGVVHCHPGYGSMFALAQKPIPVCIEEGIVYLGGDIAVSEYRMTGSDELAAEVVRHPRRPRRGADGQPRPALRRALARRMPCTPQRWWNTRPG